MNDIITQYTQEKLSGISNVNENHRLKVDEDTIKKLESFTNLMTKGREKRILYIGETIMSP